MMMRKGNKRSVGSVDFAVKALVEAETHFLHLLTANAVIIWIKTLIFYIWDWIRLPQAPKS